MPDLRQFEARSADHLRLVLEAGNIGIWELDVATGKAQRNKAHDEIFGYSGDLDEWTYDLFLHHVIESDRERVDDLQKTAIAENHEWSFQCEIKTAKGQRRWISARGRPLMGPDGSVTKLIGHVIDISDTKEREARLTLLTDELNHRVRNMLGVIRSIVRLSARKAKDIPSFATALEGRVEALARSHDMLVSDAADTMMVSDVLRSELAALPDVDDRVSFESSRDFMLGPSTAQGLALVFHELITNALKHGALSNDRGTVTVRLDEDEGRPRLLWEEHGGPEVCAAHNDGFGSTLIANALGPKGRVDIQFAPEGVTCELRLPQE